MEQGLDEEVGLIVLGVALQHLVQQLLVKGAALLLHPVDARRLQVVASGFGWTLHGLLISRAGQVGHHVLPGALVMLQHQLDVPGLAAISVLGQSVSQECVGLINAPQIHADGGQLGQQHGSARLVRDQLGLELHQLGHHAQVTHFAIDLPRAGQGLHILGVQLERLLVCHHGPIFSQEEVLESLSQQIKIGRLLLLILDLLHFSFELFDEVQPVGRGAQALFDVVHRFPVHGTGKTGFAVGPRHLSLVLGLLSRCCPLCRPLKFR